ncbi:MAG: pseudaminic acid synthase [Candidatus Berkelbacteria bacterium]|nr:pseudaminic acid synthase [Candidatus Berkelbacteria bacterium]
MKILNKKIGNDAPVFVIAELSANHNQNFNLAVKTIRAMKKSGADAVKIQTYTADTLTIDSDQEYFKIKQGTIWDGATLHKLYQQAYTPWEWQPKLKKVAEELGMIFFSSPFDKSAVDFLQKMKVPAYKIASFEITDHGLIGYAAKKKKPMIISTGVATRADISDALRVCKAAGNEQVALLKCTSAYPAASDEMNLKTIPDMAKKFKVVVGLSDHSIGQTAAIAAVALGAKIIEKHFILDRKMGGPDSSFSMEPEEFKSMVLSIRDTEKALGKVTYELSKNSQKSRELSRSLFVVEDVKQGEKFTAENIRSIRPGFGLAPKFLDQILGKKAKTFLSKGTPLSWKLIDWEFSG